MHLTLSIYVQLRLVLDEILNQEGAVRPKAVRYFRAQMQTIITRALNDINIKGIPSRRCFSLLSKLPYAISDCSQLA